jgi:hypothetical protein
MVSAAGHGHLVFCLSRALPRKQRCYTRNLSVLDGGAAQEEKKGGNPRAPALDDTGRQVRCIARVDTHMCGDAVKVASVRLLESAVTGCVFTR